MDGSGDVLLVTGASSGIGAATARAAVGAGFRVALGARRGDALDELVAELGDENALGAVCDVGSWEEQEAFVAAMLEKFGRVDAVFANAGTSAQMGLLKSSPEEWEAMVRTNVLGAALTVRATLPHLLERERGHYVFTGSQAGSRPVPGSLYGATKAAVANLADGLRAELKVMHKVDAVRVTLLELGAVGTEMTPAELPFEPLTADDVATTVIDALQRPERVNVGRVVLSPVGQP